MRDQQPKQTHDKQWIQTIIKSLLTKKHIGPDELLIEFCQSLRWDQEPIPVLLFQDSLSCYRRIETEEYFQTFSMKTSRPKPDKHMTTRL